MSSQGGFTEISEAIKTGNISSKIFDPSTRALNEFLESAGIPLKQDIKAKTSMIASIPINKRKRIIKEMQHRFGFSYPNAKYMPVLTEIEGYDLKEVTVPDHILSNKKETTFEVDFPYNANYTFVGSQFLTVETSVPELADPSQVPDDYIVKFWYCQKPGIRLIKRVEALSDISAFDSYKQEDVLKYENDCLPDNMYEIWNRLIGQDLGVDAQVYNVTNEFTEVRRIKNGYQTGKEVQEPLKLYIPLLFAHNRNLNDKINLSTFNKNTLSIKGEFALNSQIVRAAAFDPNNLGAAPIMLDVKPLTIVKCGLLSLFSALDNLMYALNMQIYYSNLYSYTKSDRYETKDSRNIKLKNRDESLQLAVIARPKWYANDFDYWTEFTPVQKQCYPVPVAQLNPLTGLYSVVVQGAEYLEPIQPFEYINLFHNGICMMADGSKDGTGDPEIWNNVDVYSKSIRYPNYRVRKPGMVYFNFNPHVNTKKIACIYNFGKLSDSYLVLKFNPDIGINSNNGDLNEPYELIVYSDAINNHIASGDAMVKTLITS